MYLNPLSSYTLVALCSYIKDGHVTVRYKYGDMQECASAMIISLTLPFKHHDVICIQCTLAVSNELFTPQGKYPVGTQ